MSYFLLLLISIFLFVAPGVLTAQDVIIKMNLDSIQTKVLEVGPDFVQYQIVRKDEVKIKMLDRREIYKIIYNNGTVDSIRGNRPANKIFTNSKDRILQAKENGLIYMTVSDLPFNLISGGIMYTFPGGHVSVAIPLSYGMIYLGIIDTITNTLWNNEYQNERKGYFNPYKSYSTGLDLNFYPQTNVSTKFLFNFSFGTGKFKYKYSYYDSANFNGWVYEEEIGNYYSLFTKIGLRIAVAKHLDFLLCFGPGIVETVTQTKGGYMNSISNEKRHHTELEGGFMIGYKF